MPCEVCMLYDINFRRKKVSGLRLRRPWYIFICMRSRAQALNIDRRPVMLHQTAFPSRTRSTSPLNWARSAPVMASNWTPRRYDTNMGTADT